MTLALFMVYGTLLLAFYFRRLHGAETLGEREDAHLWLIGFTLGPLITYCLCRWPGVTLQVVLEVLDAFVSN